jgi:hypothetical protein
MCKIPIPFVKSFLGGYCSACNEINDGEVREKSMKMYVDCIKKLSDCQYEKKSPVIRKVHKILFPNKSEK